MVTKVRPLCISEKFGCIGMDVERMDIGELKIELTSFETGELIEGKRVSLYGDFLRWEDKLSSSGIYVMS